MFEELKEINSRPAPFEFYTAEELWTDEHTSSKMLEYHLDDSVELSSRSSDFVERSVKWIVSHFGIDSSTSIADFGCGPGLYTIQFAATEFYSDVAGSTYFPESADIAVVAKKAETKNLQITA